MEKSSFFNAVINNDIPDRLYKAEEFARFFSSFIGNGVFPNPATNLNVVGLNNNMTITVKEGKAWINGYFYENTNDLILEISNADGVLNRIDRVVIRLDFLNREIRTYVKKGSFATNPIAPAVQRDADIYELAIADIRVNAGTINITQANITDLRLNKELCGIVKGTIEEIDTTTLFNQLQAYIQEKSLDMQTWIDEAKEFFTNDFNIWFEGIKDILDENTAGNLLNEINKLKEAIEGMELTSTKVTRPNGETVEESIAANETSIQEANTTLENLTDKVNKGQNLKMTHDDGRYVQIIGGNIDDLSLGWHNVFNATGTLPPGYTSNNNDFLIENKGVGVDWYRQILYDVRSYKKFERMRLNGSWSDWREL